MANLILASASEHRLELLKSIDLAPDSVIAADIDETPHKDEKPQAFVVRVAAEKAMAVAQKHPDDFVIAADTIAALGARIIGKARDIDGARKTIKSLSGRKHDVYTGLCVIAPGGETVTRRIKTIVKFKPIEPAELEAYLSSNAWVGKSGCYGIQSRGGGFVERINGSFSNVVGLPLVEVSHILRGLGYKG